MPFDETTMPTSPEKPAGSNSSHAIPPKNIIEVMHADNNTQPSPHEQPVQEAQQIVAPEVDKTPSDNLASKIVDNILLSQEGSTPKPTQNNPSQMTMTELTDLLTRSVNNIDGVTNNDIDTLQRLFESSDAQIYRPDYSDPISMVHKMTMEDYVKPLQTKFPNTPPFMLERYVDMVLAESKSGQTGWFGKSPVLTPQDVFNYDQKYQKKEFGTLIITTSDTQILFRNMQAIEKIALEQTKTENINRANKQRVARKIIKNKTSKISKPEIKIENISFESFTDKGYPTIQEIKNLIIEQYFPNKNPRDITVTIVKGGANTNIIYCLSYQNKPVFFLKISDKGNSSQRLIDMQQNFIGKIGMQSRYESALTSNLQKNLPIVTWMEKLYTYKDQGGNNRTIEIMHAAKGESMKNIIWTIPHTTTSQLIACSSAGKALGSFQQFFMNYVDSHDPETWQTVIHGDFNRGNIFFDASMSQVYFIDNETMRASNSNNTMDEDLNSFIASIDYSALALHKSFINGYLESFPTDKRSTLAQYLKKYSIATPKLFDPYITPSTQPEVSTVNQPLPAAKI